MECAAVFAVAARRGTGAAAAPAAGHRPASRRARGSAPRTLPGRRGATGPRGRWRRSRPRGSARFLAAGLAWPRRSAAWMAVSWAAIVLEALLDRRARPAEASLPLVEPVDGVLDALQPLGDRADPAGQALDVGRRRDVQRAEGGLLGLGRLLARLEGPGDGAGDQRVLEQVLGELADRVLALPGEPLAEAGIVVGHGATVSPAGRRRALARGGWSQSQARVEGQLHQRLTCDAASINLRVRCLGQDPRAAWPIDHLMACPSHHATVPRCGSRSAPVACGVPNPARVVGFRRLARESGRSRAGRALVPMNKHKLLIGLLVAGIFTAGLGAAIFPASAEQRTFRVTFQGGTTTIVTLDVPAGTAASQVSIPGAALPIVGIEDITPAGAPRPRPRAPRLPQRPPSRSPARSRPAASPSRAPRRVRRPPAGSGVRLRLRFRLRSPRSSSRPRRSAAPPPTARPTARPTAADPTFSFALPGPAPIGVPNFFIEKFRIPPFLLPIYQAAGIQYGVRWEILAAINEIETDYGRNLNVSSAGALGWMQFMPATWKQLRRRRQQRRQKDPYNPVDAIFAAARYLKAAGADNDIRRAIFAYNHADWYVDSVLLRARLIGGLPADLVGSLTGPDPGPLPRPRQGALRRRRRPRRDGPRASPRAATPRMPVERRPQPHGHRRSSPRPARRSSPCRTADRRAWAYSKRLGRYIRLQRRLRQHLHLRHLEEVAKAYPVPEAEDASPRAQVARELELPEARPEADRAPPAPARRPRRGQGRRAAAPATAPPAAAPPRRASPRSACSPTRTARRLRDRRRGAAAQRRRRSPATRPSRPTSPQVFGLKRDDVVLKRLKVGSRVIARHDPRPPRQDAERRRRRTCSSRSAPPARAPRGSTRSRSSTAGSCSSPPRSTARPARTRSSAPTPRTPPSARSC